MSLTQAVPSISEAKTMPRTISEPKAEYNVAIGYLRAFLTLLVVAHHAAIAYATFTPPVAPSLTAPPRWWPAFPIVDARKWAGASLSWDSTTPSLCRSTAVSINRRTD